MQTLEIQLATSNVGFDGHLDYKGKTFEAHGITKGYIKARLAKLLKREFDEGVDLKFANELLERLTNKVEETQKVVDISVTTTIEPMKKTTKKEKTTTKIDELPLYSNPLLVVAGDKAKFPYDKAMTDFCVVDILNVEDANNGGFNIYWSMEHDATKSFWTYVRKGNLFYDEPEYVVGTTITAAMVKGLSIPQQAKPNNPSSKNQSKK